MFDERQKALFWIHFWMVLLCRDSRTRTRGRCALWFRHLQEILINFGPYFLGFRLS